MQFIVGIQIDQWLLNGEDWLSVPYLIQTTFLEDKNPELWRLLACGNHTSYKAKYWKAAHYVDHITNGFIIANQFRN
jgi:hypothetical protein